MNCFFLNRG